MRRHLAIALVLSWASLLQAQPVVHVRAETRIELVERRGDPALLRGSLRDDLGEPLPRRDVTIEVIDSAGTGHLREVVRTGPDGAFQLAVPGELTSYRARARFAGDDTHDPVAVERRFDRRRAGVHLALDVGGRTRLDLDADDHEVTVRAECEAGVADLPVELLDEADRPLASGRTGADGRWTIRLPSAAFGNPGVGRLVARTPGDSRRSEARTELPIVRYRRTRLSLTSSSARVRPGETVELRGTLRDSAGPLPRRGVGIFRGADHQATVLTDTRGAFRWTTQLEASATESLVFRARFDSDSPGHGSSESAPVVLAADGLASVRWAWSLLPLGLCAAALWWLRRRDPRVHPPTLLRPTAGVSLGERSRGRRSRRLGGRLLDARDDSPLAGTLLLEGPEPARHAVGPASFSLELAEGAWTATFEAEGRAPVTERFTVPHDGRWDRIEVHLETWRARALAAFRGWMRRRAPDLPWRERTIRELRGELPPAAAPLADDVERAYYGPIPPEAEDVRQIEARVSQLEPPVDSR